MIPQEVIIKKRDKQTLSNAEIEFFIKGITDGNIDNAQIGAFTMACLLNGLNEVETKDLTLAMRNSGNLLQWNVAGPVVDKHSSGGVGDKLSLMIAPMVAACGGFVPMITGRGLGHTGGTADKLESIPKYNITPSDDLFKKTVQEVGCAIIGQTQNLAPADKKIYAIRDISGTVESIELITASILSKKLAAGLQYLVMDLKCGNGAFMQSFEQAKKLAQSIVKVANLAGTKTTALITDMNSVLGSTAGNAVEIKEVVDYLSNKKVNLRVHQITMALCQEMLVSSKLANTESEAKAKLEQALHSGKALEKFAQMLSSLGAPADFCEKAEQYLPQAPIIRPVFAATEGYVCSMNTRQIGLSIIGLKGGRTLPEQKLNLATGYSEFCQIGDRVGQEKPLAVVHASNEEEYAFAADEIKKSIYILQERPQEMPCIYEKVE